MDDQNLFTDDTMSEEDERMDFTNNREIHTKENDREVKSLYEKYQSGRLDIQPEFQRRSVWDVKKDSRLIESAILDIPLPIIYLSEEQDGKESVIDGQQRLTAFFSFIEGKHIEEGKRNGQKTKLAGLNVLHRELDGKSYKDLPTVYQEKIKCFTLRVISFRKNSDSNLKFEIFQRLNSGAVPLNDQEMRNCLYRGRYNTLLCKLSENPGFRKIMGSVEPDKRMRDIEQVLKFAAFYFQNYLSYTSPMKKFMNKEMQMRQHISEEDEKSLEKAFKNATSSVFTVFGENAFRRWKIDDDNITKQKQFSAALYDILMGEFAQRDRNAITRNANSIREALIHLSVSDKRFEDSISLSTSNSKRVKTRFDMWRTTLDNILTHETTQPRCFSYKIKKELFDKDPTCLICGQRIMDIDDAAVDHIKQYWLGGETIPENARLTHRHCNNIRSRKEQSPRYFNYGRSE